MSTPDVRVRLSPEGIKEVIFALRQVQKEAAASNKASASGLGVIKSALSDLKSLLPTLGLAAVVGGFAAMTKAAVNTADQTGKLQQKVGGTVEEISGLTLAFRTNESDQAGLQTALLKTAQVIGQVRAGSSETSDALKAIGVDAQALTGLTTPRALEAIAKGLAKIPPGAERAAAAQKLFGKQSGELLVALDAVGKDGIDAFIAKAAQLGVLIDGDLADAAARANDALGIIKIQAEGLATQFAAGLAPQIAGAMEDFSAAIQGDGFNAMRDFAEGVGFFIRFIVGEFIVLGKIIGANVAAIGVLAGAVADAVGNAARLDFSAAKRSFTDAFKTLSEMSEQLETEKAQIRERVATPAERKPRSAAGAGGDVPVIDTADAQKTAAARAAFLKAQIQNELKLQQEGFKFAEQEAKSSYERGLISLEQFYAARREIVLRAAAAEADALKLERVAVADQLGKTTGNEPGKEAERIKLRQQLAALNAEIQAKEIATQKELASLAQEEFEANKALGEERATVAAKLAELENDRHAQFQRNLDSEIKQIRELGARAGEGIDSIEAKVGRLVAARTAQFDFEEATRKGEAALAGFTRDAQQIHRDQEAGIITQLEGEQRLIELEGKRIATLQQLAASMLAAANATGGEEQIAKAQAFADSIDQIAASYKAATDVGAQFKQGAVEAFQTGVQSLLANVQNIESVGDAFKQLARSIAQSLQQIAAEILAKQATLALTKALFGVAAAKRGGYVRGYAAGGDIAGPPLPIRGPDKIPILAQKGEFMMRKARVQEPGALDFLRRWNSGAFTLAQAMRLPKFATGGEIGAATGTPASAGAGGVSQQPIQLRMVNVLDPELVNDALASASGERTMLNVIQRNSTSIKRMLGG